MTPRKSLFLKLRDSYRDLKSFHDPHIEQSTLSDMGIDKTLVDLKEETACKGIYFCPLSPDRWKMIRDTHKGRPA